MNSHEKIKLRILKCFFLFLQLNLSISKRKICRGTLFSCSTKKKNERLDKHNLLARRQYLLENDIGNEHMSYAKHVLHTHTHT